MYLTMGIWMIISGRRTTESTRGSDAEEASGGHCGLWERTGRGRQILGTSIALANISASLTDLSNACNCGAVPSALFRTNSITYGFWFLSVPDVFRDSVPDTMILLTPGTVFSMFLEVEYDTWPP